MQMQKKDLGNNALNLRLALCKLGITACLAIMLSLFLFACGSAKEGSGSTDSAAITTPDTAGATVDTMIKPMDTSTTRPDSTPIH